MKIAAFASGWAALGIEHSKMMPTAHDGLIPKRDFSMNTGDWFVSYAIDRILDYEELLLIRSYNDKAIEKINNECTALVLRGGNFLGKDKLIEQYPIELLKRIRIPIVILGIGIQEHIGKCPKLSQQYKQWLQCIDSSGGGIVVRGETSYARIT